MSGRDIDNRPYGAPRRCKCGLRADIAASDHVHRAGNALVIHGLLLCDTIGAFRPC